MKEIKSLLIELLSLGSTDFGDKEFIMKFDAKIKLQDELMDKLKELARKNNTLLGRIVKFQMADSYAYYVISKVNTKTVEVSWVDYCDGWIDNRLGKKGSLSINYVQPQIKFEDFIETR